MSLCMRRSPIFITVEGAEGSGKSTQIRRLARYLRARGIPVTVTREPGGTAAGRRLRTLLLSSRTRHLTPNAELFLMLADRAQHTDEVIRPALRQGRTVISDRYGDSTLAYQGYGRGLDLPTLRRLNRLATRGLQPGLTLLLDGDEREGLRRARRNPKPNGTKGKGDRFEREKSAFHGRVRRGFLALARREPGRFRVIRTTGKDIEAVWNEVRSAMGKTLPRER